MRDRPDVEALKPLMKRFWAVEDGHGHRYMAQVVDANGDEPRWLVPFSRSEFEQLFAAIAKAHPEFVDAVGSPGNLVRQIVGNTMWYMSQAAVHDPVVDVPPEVRAASLVARAAQQRGIESVYRNLVEMMKDESLTWGMRLDAYKVLSTLDEPVLDAIFGVRGNMGSDALTELAVSVGMAE